MYSSKKTPVFFLFKNLNEKISIKDFDSSTNDFFKSLFDIYDYFKSINIVGLFYEIIVTSWLSYFGIIVIFAVFIIKFSI
jgi:hypothetical protein